VFEIASKDRQKMSRMFGTAFQVDGPACPKARRPP